MSEDESHLDGLAVGHYVVGGIMVCFACLPLFHTFIGLALILDMGSMESSMSGGSPGPPPTWFGWLFFLMGLGFFIVGQAVSIAVILSGRYLKQRRCYWFTFVMACIACTFMPFGTVLGVLTLIVLCRPSVKVMFGVAPTPPALRR